MKINRFPKMAALQKFRALKLGFGKNLAEAIGIAEATKYAIFKNISYKKRVEKEKKEVFKEYKEERSLDDKTFEVFKLQSLDGLPYVGGKVYSSEDYKKSVFKFGNEIGRKIEEWAEGIINSCNEDVLKKESKFFNECWKPHRDELKEI